MASGWEEIDSVLDPTIEIPEELEPDLSDVLPRRYLSVSQVTRFIKCPRQWQLIYIDGKAQRTSARMFQGVHVHAAAERALSERLATGEAPPIDFATEVFSSEFERTRDLIEDWEGQDPGASKDVGVKCTRTLYESAIPASTPVAVEKEFHSVIRSADGKIHLPMLGRIDSIQAQVMSEDDYQRIRANLVMGKKLDRPRRLHDIKVSTDPWSKSELENDVQFAVYAHVEGIADVQVDNVVKGRAKVPKPRYQSVTAVMDPKNVRHSLGVLEDAAKSISLGHFPRTDPSNWWCSRQWCPVFSHCRGKE